MSVKIVWALMKYSYENAVHRVTASAARRLLSCAMTTYVKARAINPHAVMNKLGAQNPGPKTARMAARIKGNPGATRVCG